MVPTATQVVVGIPSPRSPSATGAKGGVASGAAAQGKGSATSGTASPTSGAFQCAICDDQTLSIGILFRKAIKYFRPTRAAITPAFLAARVGAYLPHFCG